MALRLQRRAALRRDDAAHGARVHTDAPGTSTRVIVATNTYDELDVENFAVELATFILEGE